MARKTATASASKPKPKPGAQVSGEASKDAGHATKKGSIIFFHPDLGIGGAERLVVDAAVGLQERGNKVVVFTNHCDPKHCFDECRDGTLDVRVRASGPIPIAVFGRLTILCAILRHVYLLLITSLTGELASLRPRALIVDQLSAGLPLMQYLLPDSPILFYCHFPDLHLARGREFALKRMYRIPFDKLEEWSMGFGNAVAVNSKFTGGIVSDTWPGLRNILPIKVLYPCVDTTPLGRDEEKLERKNAERILRGDKVILSINRFERKKDIGLAVRAFAAIPAEQRQGVRLVLAGGYDSRIAENVEYHKELQQLCATLSLTHHTQKTSLLETSPPPCSEAPVLFLLSVPNDVKAALLRTARLLAYTPQNEHFGIVPIEAMRSRLPVLATSTGGPTETVLHDVTGWLYAADDLASWTATMARCLAMGDAQLRKMGDAGAERVREIFGRDKMARSFEDAVTEMRSSKARRHVAFNIALNLVAIGFAFGIGLGIAFFVRNVLGRKVPLP